MGGLGIRERDGKEGAAADGNAMDGAGTEDTALAEGRTRPGDEAAADGLGEGDPLVLLAESRALVHVWELLHNPAAPAIPGGLNFIFPLSDIHRELCEIREVMKRYAAWDLEVSPESRGILPGYLKALQSNLRHLVWRMRMTLEGDTAAQKNPLGEFSGVFDDLIRRMEKALPEGPERDGSRRMTAGDDLTGTLNRESFTFRALIELYAAFARGERCCLAVADLDYFKAFNDCYGRRAGDGALEHAAKVIGGQLRKTDLLGRWGGDKFALFFQGAGIDVCRNACERILQALLVTPFSVREEPAPLTASIGITPADPEEFGINGDNFCFPDDNGEIIAELAGRAEKALYEAKRAGRNRVVSFTVSSE